MKVFGFADLESLSKEMAGRIKNVVLEKPDLVLSTPTGATPVILYEELVGLYKKGEIDFSNITFFQIDEYCGLKDNDKRSFKFYLENNLLNHINIKKENCFFLTENNYQDYEAKIKEKGGFDLCILGIGKNGHIAFNEPGSKFDSKTRLVDLSPETLKSNFPCPKQALTIGLGTIMNSRKIYLLADKNKSAILEEVINGNITENVPASILQKHKDATIFMVT